MVILIGPFLDIRNPLIAEANLTFEAQWVKVLETIGKATENLEIEVVLVTSLRDVHSLPIYPQVGDIPGCFSDIVILSRSIALHLSFSLSAPLPCRRLCHSLLAEVLP